MKWKLTDEKWELLRPLLKQSGPATPGVRGGRPRSENDRAAAEACLYRYYHSNSEHYRCFGWNRLPKKLKISPATANRRFREWTTNGSWARFWQGWQALRNQSRKVSTAVAPRAKVPVTTGWTVKRTLAIFPLGDIMAELERAYVFFNDCFFGGDLPRKIALSIEHKIVHRCRGYFCGHVWRKGRSDLGHIAIHTSVFDGGAEEALAVLLHEMVHLRNSTIGLRDCDPRNQYHNRYFRDQALLVGLTCEPRHPRFGYALTELSDAGRDAISRMRPDNTVFRWSTQR